jgi:hypothetical protein
MTHYKITCFVLALLNEIMFICTGDTVNCENIYNNFDEILKKGMAKRQAQSCSNASEFIKRRKLTNHEFVST